ncbi:TniQ family protein [Nocardia sp. NPDC056611]|uniref:TniQ family protein n=1 Tax=Nocardia sp. NPDC056611 TaxID=3345877 RepID=UPI00366D43D9
MDSRTLPIRVAPHDGEALDSWLEAIAARTRTDWAALLSATGLSSDYARKRQNVVELTDVEAAALAVATSLDINAIHAMTLRRFNGVAVRLLPDRRVDRRFPWSRERGSRFCPRCLGDTGGRWQLNWRLGWSFACLQHRCLLADVCPHCVNYQRYRAFSGHTVPTPGRCASATPGGPHLTRCGADLSTTPVTMLVPDHPVLVAQGLIDAIIRCGASDFGLYAGNPQPTATVLADMREIGSRVLRDARDRELATVADPALLAAYRNSQEFRPKWRTHPDTRRWATPAAAATAAVGVVGALHVLGAGSGAQAADRLRWVLELSRREGRAINPATLGKLRHISPVLARTQLAALGPYLAPLAQLRYRTSETTLRTTQAGPACRAQPLVTRLPAMLWQEWALRFIVRGCSYRRLRAALPVALLHVGTPVTLTQALTLLDSPIGEQLVGHVVGTLERDSRWPDIRSGLIRMADHLAEIEVPINYQRRRSIDYTGLMPERVWRRICRDTGTAGPSGNRADTVRYYLFARLSGLPFDARPEDFGDTRLRFEATEFPRYLTPKLAAALDAYATEFLAVHGIVKEPVIWRPTPAILDALDLPGPDPATIDVPRLHQLVSAAGQTRKGSTRRATQTLSTTPPIVRYLLEVYPVAPRPQARRGEVWSRALRILPEQLLTELYLERGHSVATIAAQTGISRKVVTRLADHYGIARRPHVTPRTPRVDRDWFYDQYINCQRSLKDLSNDTGVDLASLVYWADRYGIRRRASGALGHRATVEAQVLAESAPEVLRTALQSPYGWQRLSRFVVVANLPTLSIGAAQLGVHKCNLVTQIRRLEHDVGGALFTDNPGNGQLKTTPLGEMVLAAMQSMTAVALGEQNLSPGSDD